MTLDLLPLGQRAGVTAVDWTVLAPDAAQRLQALGLDVTRGLRWRIAG